MDVQAIKYENEKACAILGISQDTARDEPVLRAAYRKKPGKCILTSMMTRMRSVWTLEFRALQQAFVDSNKLLTAPEPKRPRTAA